MGCGSGFHRWARPRRPLVSDRLSFALDKGEVEYVRTKVSMGVMAGHVVPELPARTRRKKSSPR